MFLLSRHCKLTTKSLISCQCDSLLHFILSFYSVNEAHILYSNLCGKAKYSHLCLTTSNGFSDLALFLPQLNRDKDGSASTESQMWGQPKVKLERLGLVQDFEKRPKPVVVLKKLSVDQIQRLIRHSKSGKNRFSSGKSGKGEDKKLPSYIYLET